MNSIFLCVHKLTFYVLMFLPVATVNYVTTLKALQYGYAKTAAEQQLRGAHTKDTQTVYPTNLKEDRRIGKLLELLEKSTALVDVRLYRYVSLPRALSLSLTSFTLLLGPGFLLFTDVYPAIFMWHLCVPHFAY